mmetsp:Transcript_6076/g.16922  ORF Transcript_6076/g.16922 Transcript_6076/m.16922 type:complete len:300 (-) Transcript_6076:465-1364(-)
MRRLCCARFPPPPPLLGSLAEALCASGGNSGAVIGLWERRALTLVPAVAWLFRTAKGGAATEEAAPEEAVVGRQKCHDSSDADFGFGFLCGASHHSLSGCFVRAEVEGRLPFPVPVACLVALGSKTLALCDLRLSLVTFFVCFTLALSGTRRALAFSATSSRAESARSVSRGPSSVPSQLLPSRARISLSISSEPGTSELLDRRVCSFVRSTLSSMQVAERMRCSPISNMSAQAAFAVAEAFAELHRSEPTREETWGPVKDRPSMIDAAPTTGASPPPFGAGQMAGSEASPPASVAVTL